ncbi:MAG: hypothetical protein GY914_04880 [Prochlorococcus sp.]|jgi:hypothetical protein|nr:hypothetical protein [Prochlorococcus sp.]
MVRFPAVLLSGLTLATGCFALLGCQNNPLPRANDLINQAEAINRLELRLEQLERRVGEQLPPLADTNNKTPAGPVKSLTFRMEEMEGRLRIYWEDGSDSDLLCTKEQSTRVQWACG